MPKRLLATAVLVLAGAGCPAYDGVYCSKKQVVMNPCYEHLDTEGVKCEGPFSVTECIEYSKK